MAFLPTGNVIHEVDKYTTTAPKVQCHGAKRKWGLNLLHCPQPGATPVKTYTPWQYETEDEAEVAASERRDSIAWPQRKKKNASPGSAYSGQQRGIVWNMI